MSNKLTLSTGEILRSALNCAGMGRNIEDMDDATEADLRTIVRSGLRRFLFPMVGEFPYRWRWLERYYPIPFVDSYAEGTIGIAAGTVTLTSGVFPSWAEDGFITVNGNILFVTQRVTDTTAVVSHTELIIDAGTAYTLQRYRYPLPDDFGEFMGGVTYTKGSDNWMLAPTSEAEIRLRYGQNYNWNNRTSHYAIVAMPSGSFNIMFWPIPLVGAFAQGTYTSIPEDQLGGDLRVADISPIIQCQAMYAECCIEAILAAAEAYNNDSEGIHEKRFQTTLATCVAHDKSTADGYDFSRDCRGKGYGWKPFPTSINFDNI